MDNDVATLGSAGRFVIPAAYRRALGVESGDELLLRFEDGELRITTRQLAVARARALVRRHVPDGVSLSDELLAERRDVAEPR